MAILARHHRLEVGRQCYLRPATASANDDWPRRGGQAAQEGLEGGRGGRNSRPHGDRCRRSIDLSNTSRDRLAAVSSVEIGEYGAKIKFWDKQRALVELARPAALDPRPPRRPLPQRPRHCNPARDRRTPVGFV